MTDPDGCPLCGSTRFTVDPIDVSSGGRRRFVPGLRSCLDCHDGGAPVLLAEVERLRGLLARLEWADHDENRDTVCAACGGYRYDGGHDPAGCWLAKELQRRVPPDSPPAAEGPTPRDILGLPDD